MYSLALILDIMTSVFALIPMVWLASAVRRLGVRPAARHRRLAGTATWSWRVLLALLLIKLVAAGIVLFGYGPAFAVRPLREAIVLAAPLVLTFLWTRPVLRSIRRGGDDDPRALRFALPARLLAAAGGAVAVLSMSVPTNGVMFGVIAVFALVGFVTTVDAVQTVRKADGLPATARWRSGLARLSAPLVIVLAAGGCGAIGAAGTAMPGAVSMAHQHGAVTGPTRSVKDLTGAPSTGPVKKFTITASARTFQLTSGASVDGWTFDNTAIRVTQGDVVEATLVNRLPDAGATIHWHGIDVPNAMDGVAGVTQDVVKPGQSFTYRFTANAPGTYWYHSHQLADEQVGRGLFGSIVVDPAQPTGDQVDETLLYHQWVTDRGDRAAFGTDDGVSVHRTAPGSKIRVRVVNAETQTRDFTVAGASWRLVALDGHDLHEPGEVTDKAIELGGGGRADIELTMPDHPVRVGVSDKADLGYVLSPDGTSTVAGSDTESALDLLHYGTPDTTPFDAGSAYDRTYDVDLDQGFGFRDGGLGFLWTMNGKVFPDVPMLTVAEGDLVRVTFRNRSLTDHPMHLHGHHVLVLAKDGEQVDGSPLWLDTVLVRPGETWQIAFRADNPGLWMDHCHDLQHASVGMTMHLGYEGVSSPYTVGSDSGNLPE